MLPWGSLHAQQSRAGTVRVSATVAESCDVAVPDLVLGQRGPRPALSATCTPHTTYFVSPNRRITGATVEQVVSAVLAPTQTGVGTGKPVDHTLFGGVPATQVVPSGESADIASVRVYY